MAVQWHKVYHELAVLLARFAEAQSQNPPRRFADLCRNDKAIANNNTWINRVLENDDEDGIDPIQFFANLSEPNAGTALRSRRIRTLMNALGDEFDDDIDFTGCPTMFNIKVTARRDNAVQRQIWQLLVDVIGRAQEALTLQVFANMQSWYGVNITALTVFLFWIDAENFLPMDQNTVSFLEQEGRIKGRPRNFNDYFNIISDPGIRNYPEISIRAKSSSLLQPKKTLRTVPEPDRRSATIPQKKEKDQRQIKGCRVIAMRIYNTTDEKWRKVLDKNGKVYIFYKAFVFKETIPKFDEYNDQEIPYNSSRDIPLYQEGKLDIHVSAIVGENGSGKSTLTELFFLLINNFTKAFATPNSLIAEDQVFADLFFITDALYKLSVQGSTFLLKRYERDNDTFYIKEEVTLLEFDFERLFYSIVTNYALYALNSVHVGEWIDKLFHKNDQYQVPINISPLRNAGNININRENNLVKTRLVANLLLPVDKRKRRKDTIRQLTAAKAAETVEVKLLTGKLNVLYEYPEKTDHNFTKATDYWTPVLTAIKDAFKIPQPVPVEVLTEPKDYTEACWMYLLKKIISICMTYPSFAIYFLPGTNTFRDISGLIKELQRQKSHVTHKFYQALHFLIHDHYQQLRETTDMQIAQSYDIANLSDTILELVKAKADKQIKTIHFAPPAFLDLTIKLTKNTDFKDLSSGEKQRIYSVSSVVYHLLNIDSNADQDELIRYSAANIIFDEVELYFHPEMQRGFVKYLLDYLSRLELELVTSLNILFITHSPFILSDIPADNILFLGETEPNIKTFAANIHHLLAESFFLKDSFMGEYAQEVINDLISFLIDEKHTRKWDVHNSGAVINTIGEPLLKNRLLDIYAKKFESNPSLDIRMEALRNELAALENEKNKQR